MVVRACVLSLVLLCAAGAMAQVDVGGVVSTIRQALESELQNNVGYGYTSFDCDITEAFEAPGRFDCTAATGAGEQMVYSIGIDDEGAASIVLTSQPASQLTEHDRAILEPPCRDFIEDFGLRSWTTLYAPFHQALKDSVTAEAAIAILEPIRADLGVVRGAELVTHALHESGRHELVYELDCEKGPGHARFGVLPVGDGVQLVAFVITPANGSPGQAAMLEKVGRDTLSRLIGEPVVRVEAPLGQLREVGDVVEGTAWLQDGRDLPIRAEQHGRKDDFDPVDYQFNVLDLPWLLRRMLEEQKNEVRSVECPRRVADDGEVMSCVALTEAGRKVLTVQRQDGNYRLVETAPGGGE